MGIILPKLLQLLPQLLQRDFIHPIQQQKEFSFYEPVIDLFGANRQLPLSKFRTNCFQNRAIRLQLHQHRNFPLSHWARVPK
jgi:hypothetical protein